MSYISRNGYEKLPVAEATLTDDAVQSWSSVSLLLTITNICTLIGMFLMLRRNTPDAECIRQLSVYSPALDGLEMEETTLQNAFNETSIYRGPPTPELERAWHSLYRFGLMTIPDDKMTLLNKSSSDDYERVPESMGNGFRAMPDVLHQLHCLNTIRQYTWLLAGGHYGSGSRYNLTIPHALNSGDVGNRMHANHCIETIRKVLMCHADVTPMFDTVDPSNSLGRRGDFNLFTKCRSFDRLQDWLRQNTVIPFAEKDAA